MKRIEMFLVELTELTKKYDIQLYACSCCDGLNAEELDSHGHYVIKEDDPPQPKRKSVTIEWEQDSRHDRYGLKPYHSTYTTESLTDRRARGKEM